MTEEPTTSGDMPKAYDPAAFEEKLYRFWEENGYFIPKIDPEKPPFTIIMPPPNVSGDLHLGQRPLRYPDDIFTRWHRMRQEPSLWLPGQDHAAIATQNDRRAAAGAGRDRRVTTWVARRSWSGCGNGSEQYREQA